MWRQFKSIGGSFTYLDGAGVTSVRSTLETWEVVLQQASFPCVLQLTDLELLRRNRFLKLMFLGFQLVDSSPVSFQLFFGNAVSASGLAIFTLSVCSCKAMFRVWSPSWNSLKAILMAALQDMASAMFSTIKERSALDWLAKLGVHQNAALTDGG
ncbi:hypothetical protein DPEC_G00043770 [Dallia pectoralis]|uniref:Uncharacterized protein n=1 Tax=Dallia pectoralis TaxID=75939 RepID=A0ACC2H9B2_DALPE|nr:hypothetical protein DPEC_G00043770 [Dallia pectoralis]